jgi:hypothetical protein
MSVATFLRQFQQEEEGNSLLDNVNLWFSSYLSISISSRDDRNTIMQIIAQLMPTIGNINSIQMCHCHLYYLFGLHDFEALRNYAKPLKDMLIKTRILDIK